MPQHFFSKKTITNVIGLMDRFNTALGQQIKIYETTKNYLQFSKILNSLNHELFYFIDHFGAWSLKTKTAKEQKALLLLEKQLEHAKSLVQKASLLVEDIKLPHP